ncbi:MAG: hypothetical protein Q8S26_17410 [Azonexus sp.]|nr:hypothetical protein [Azonexus sp.]
MFKSLCFQVIGAIAFGVALGHFYPESGVAMKPHHLLHHRAGYRSAERRAQPRTVDEAEFPELVLDDAPDIEISHSPRPIVEHN